MGRHSTKSDGALVLLIIVVGVPLYVVSKSIETVGVGAIIGISMGAITLFLIVKMVNTALRKASLLAKYGDPEIVDRIMRKIIWVGQTKDQLNDSLGRPADTDQKVLKTKSKVIWKYHHQGGNRYGLRITVENGEVVGWDEKL